MFYLSHRVGCRSRVLAFAGAADLSIAPPVWPESCVGPASLKARVHSHPGANAYAALGISLGENHKSKCAVQALQAGLKPESHSFRLFYLLGLSLYTAGKLQESVAPLQRLVELHPKEVKARLLLVSALAGPRCARTEPGAEEFSQLNDAYRIASFRLRQSVAPRGGRQGCRATVRRSPRASGARVLARYGCKVQAQEVLSLSGYLSASDPRLHFGLGAATTADIEIHWPLGLVEKFSAFAVDQLVTIREGAGIVKSRPFRKT
jgi:hypothetical protein